MPGVTPLFETSSRCSGRRPLSPFSTGRNSGLTSRGSPAASTCSPRGSRSQYADAIVRPVGSVHWAGTEASLDDHPGYMDGAVRAGERAADEVSGVLSRPAHRSEMSRP
jgi:monoamine oxidase